MSTKKIKYPRYRNYHLLPRSKKHVIVAWRQSWWKRRRRFVKKYQITDTIVVPAFILVSLDILFARKTSCDIVKYVMEFQNINKLISYDTIILRSALTSATYPSDVTRRSHIFLFTKKYIEWLDFLEMKKLIGSFVFYDLRYIVVT